MLTVTRRRVGRQFEPKRMRPQRRARSSGWIGPSPEHGGDPPWPAGPAIPRASPRRCDCIGRVSKWTSSSLSLSAAEYDRNVEPVREAGFVIDPAARSRVTVCEIRHDEAGSAYFGDDLVVNLVDMLLPVDPHRLVTGIAKTAGAMPFSTLRSWCRRTTSRRRLLRMADGRRPVQPAGRDPRRSIGRRNSRSENSIHPCCWR